jgi:predicted phage tail protein
MSLQAWERDIINRQRNIVFPDTVMNQGRYYRNIASGKAVYALGQKVSLLIIVGYVMIVTSFGLAGNIAEVLRARAAYLALFPMWSSIYMLGVMLFWIFLAVKALFPDTPPKRRRRGYRQSSRA